jgi:hypothetical protein
MNRVGCAAGAVVTEGRSVVSAIVKQCEARAAVSSGQGQTWLRWVADRVQPFCLLTRAALFGGKMGRVTPFNYQLMRHMPHKFLTYGPFSCSDSTFQLKLFNWPHPHIEQSFVNCMEPMLERFMRVQ